MKTVVTLLALLLLGASAPAFATPPLPRRSFTPAAMPAGDVPAGSLSKTVKVPLDHLAPERGQADLYCVFGAPYDLKKPVVLVICDAEQFYVGKRVIAGIQRTFFGDGLNVVGIVGRGVTGPFLDAVLRDSGRPDWEKAWRTFSSRQWVEDIDAVRKALVGERGQVHLYGAAGGGLLVHEYLAQHGEHVGRALTLAPPDPFHEGELGLNSDHFWRDIGAFDASLQPMLLEILQRRAEDRPRILMMLQRQNFFVPTEKLQQDRADIIRGLSGSDPLRFEIACQTYRANQAYANIESRENIPVRVRECELLYPSGGLAHLKETAVYPDLETSYSLAKPFVVLCDAGEIPKPSLDFSRLRQLQTEVLILAARWDHAVHYRASMALAASYPHSQLFISDDNHVLDKLRTSGALTRLIRAFFGSGLSSAELRDALKAAAPYQWREK
jgi:pimeloyl-ACP methyl ester carboxylesterase